VRPGALDRLVDFLAAHRGTAPCRRSSSIDGTVQRRAALPSLLSALCFDSWWDVVPGSWVQARYLMATSTLRSRDVPQPPGRVLLMRRAEWLRSGGLDETCRLFFNDVDLCRRLWRDGPASTTSPKRGAAPSRASTRSFARMLVIWHKNRLAYYEKHYGAWCAVAGLCIPAAYRRGEAADRAPLPGRPDRRAARTGHLRRRKRELWAR